MTWNPDDGTYPTLWTPTGGGLSILAAHLNVGGALLRWTNALPQPVKCLAVYSLLSGTPGVGGVAAASLEQPSGNTDNLNFFGHSTLLPYQEQTYPAPYIVCNVGDAFTFILANPPTGVTAAIKLMLSF